MKNTKILDCTLRDGGYVNEFRFGKSVISKIIAQLTDANIDIIECGFLEDCVYDENSSIFNRVEQISPFIPSNRRNSMYVAMACYGEYSLDNLSIYDGTSIEGIRVTFHYNEVDEALEYCKKIQEKGYKLFVQPVGTTTYSDEKLISLIKKVNDIQPYSFYLVDTLGLMHQEDILRMFYLINHNLNASINLGFHSHNNMQLSFSNCQTLVRQKTERTVFLDSSVYGMGRGAGNLNTELIANYLNSNQSHQYEIEPLLEIVDEFIIQIKEKYTWGYSVPYYLAAINGCHPNYASYLSNKQTLPIKAIGTILRMVEHEKRSLFSEKIAEEKYREFQEREIDDTQSIISLCQEIKGKNVLLLAPGYSLTESEQKIIDLAKQENCSVISVAFVPSFMDIDYAFLSNLKRYNTSFNPTKKEVNLIHTSNIQIDNNPNKIAVNYSSLINEENAIMDNAAMMALNLLVKLSPKKVYIAGLDGYVPDKENYYLDRLKFTQDKEFVLARNEVIKNRIKDLRHNLDIQFVTHSLYID